MKREYHGEKMERTVFRFNNRNEEYSVLIGERFKVLIPEAAAMLKGHKALVLTDGITAGLYLEGICGALSDYGIPADTFIIDPGEASKSLDTLGSVLRFLVLNSYTKTDFIINLGGGVVSDLGGFAASVYMRGMNCINIPTTLLGMVDSSMGGKTAIDFEGVKNILGTVHQPSLVLCATEFLTSLDEAQIRSGCGEILKYSLICGRDLLKGYESTSAVSAEVIFECCSIKRDLVCADEFDKGIRHILNLGHTFGHAFEAASGYGLAHGEAVALGLLAEARFGAAIGVSSSETADMILEKLIKIGFSPDYERYAEKASRLIVHDKKSMGGRISMPFIGTDGKPRIVSVEISDAAGFLTGSSV